MWITPYYQAPVKKKLKGSVFNSIYLFSVFRIFDCFIFSRTEQCTRFRKNYFAIFDASEIKNTHKYLLRASISLWMLILFVLNFNTITSIYFEIFLKVLWDSDSLSRGLLPKIHQEKNKIDEEIGRYLREVSLRSIHWSQRLPPSAKTRCKSNPLLLSQVINRTMTWQFSHGEPKTTLKN